MLWGWTNLVYRTILFIERLSRFGVLGVAGRARDTRVVEKVKNIRDL